MLITAVNVLDIVVRLMCRYFDFIHIKNSGFAFGLRQNKSNNQLIHLSMTCLLVALYPNVTLIIWPNLVERVLYGTIVDYIPFFNLKINLNDIVVFCWTIDRIIN